MLDYSEISKRIKEQCYQVRLSQQLKFADRPLTVGDLITGMDPFTGFEKKSGDYVHAQKQIRQVIGRLSDLLLLGASGNIDVRNDVDATERELADKIVTGSGGLVGPQCAKEVCRRIVDTVVILVHAKGLSAG
jgi:hypothetical protein